MAEFRNPDMPQGYKHVSLDFADRFASGAIRIGTFYYYREMEGERRDPLEGVALNFVDKKIGSGGVSARDEAIFNAMGIIVTGSSDVVFSDVLYPDEIPSPYLFCCSEEPDFDLAHRDKLAIFHIPDLVKFGQAIVEVGAAHFGPPWGIGSVTYSVRTGNPFHAGILTADPLIKDPKFAHEREVRFLFEPNGAPKAPYLDLKVPAISAFIHRLA